MCRSYEMKGGTTKAFFLQRGNSSRIPVKFQPDMIYCPLRTAIYRVAHFKHVGARNNVRPQLRIASPECGVYFIPLSHRHLQSSLIKCSSNSMPIGRCYVATFKHYRARSCSAQYQFFNHELDGLSVKRPGSSRVFCSFD